MKKFICVSMLLGSLFVMNGCSDESQVFNEDNKSMPVDVNSKVINLIKDFALTANSGNVTSKAASDFEVNSITKKTIFCSLGDTKARSAESTAVDIYSVEFTKEGKKGFSIATDDERINRVFAYTENGQLADTIFNNGLKMFINAVPYYCEGELKEYYTPQVKATKSLITQTVSNFVPTKWDQGGPYNNNCPPCSSNSNGHTLLGCGPVAVAQALAYYGKQGLTTRYWPYIMFADQEYIFDNGSQAAVSVASFAYNIASLCSASFGCDATGVKFSNCRKAFDAYGISHDYHDGNLKQSGTWNALVKKNIVVAYGSTGKVGHIWLYTGAMAYVDSSSKVVDSIISLYANWGWAGIDDGWYYNDRWEKPSSAGTNYYKDNAQILITKLK